MSSEPQTGTNPQQPINGALNEFVNPFTFVPFTGVCERHQPPGHARGDRSVTNGTSQELLSGTLQVEWTCLTPMLLPADAEKELWIRGGSTQQLPSSSSSSEGLREIFDATVSIPGSATKGAVRSLHEMMFNGCLQVFNDDLRPAYRDSLTGDLLTGWRLAVVTKAEHGVAKEVQLAVEGTIWVEATKLADAYGNAKADGNVHGIDAQAPLVPRSGDLVTILDRPERSSLRRLELRQVQQLTKVVRPDADTPWEKSEFAGQSIVLVTDTAARPKLRGSSKSQRARAYWATAKLTDTTCEVSEEGNTYFRNACAGARDARASEKKTQDQEGGPNFRTENLYEEVKWWRTLDPASSNLFTETQKVIAHRMKATGFLHVGAVVWAYVADGEVTKMKLAAAWRTPTDATKGITDRFPAELKECSSPQNLCLTCTTFGMIGATDDEPSYRGHVRFLDATATSVTLTEEKIVPMGAPSPGAAGMYLEPGILGPRASGARMSSWNSAMDDGEPRPIRGRKRYWHSDPDEQATFWTRTFRKKNPDRKVPPRYQVRDHQETRTGGMTGEKRWLVNKGTPFNQTVTFDGLTPVGLDALIAAFDPTTIISLEVDDAPRTIAVHWGGGKPLGLGSVSVAVSTTGDQGISTIQSAAERYTSHSVHLLSPMTTERLTAIEDRCGPVRETLRLLATALDVHGLGQDRYLVWYPPHGQWSGVGGEDFDKSYEFFQQYSGEALAQHSRPFIPMPTLLEITKRQSPRLPNADRRNNGGGKR